ncbi:hypothetical protein MBIO_0492 [Mycoplasmopsis fermentans PG18]|uniref:Uncharacterized protein n=2 Tax=Mycoplasmopsis fermentans TaxID=2115 RepID=C4XF34_MYCFP|nr:hypothetical protein MBIO_0492 [Mycoplasmopsis fermentans PG18]
MYENFSRYNLTMKMPSYKDLNFNIKRELNKLKPKSFEEWKEAKSKVFCIALGKYLTKINSHQPDIFFILQIIY